MSSQEYKWCPSEAEMTRLMESAEYKWTEWPFEHRLKKLKELHQEWTNATEALGGLADFGSDGMGDDRSQSVGSRIYSSHAIERIRSWTTRPMARTPERHEEQFKHHFCPLLHEYYTQRAIDEIIAIDDVEETNDWGRLLSLACSEYSTSALTINAMKGMQPESWGAWDRFEKDLKEKQEELETSYPDRDKPEAWSQNDRDEYAEEIASKVDDRGLFTARATPSDLWPHVYTAITTLYEEIIEEQNKKGLKKRAKKQRQRDRRRAEGAATSDERLETFGSVSVGEDTSTAVMTMGDKETTAAQDTSRSFFSQDWSDPSKALFTLDNHEQAMKEMKSQFSSGYEPSFSPTALPDESSFVETYKGVLPILTQCSMTANERKASGDQEEAIRKEMLALDYSWKWTHKLQMDNFLNKNQEKIQRTSNAFQSLIQAKMAWDESRMAFEHGSCIDQLTEWTPDEQEVVNLKHQKARADVESLRTDAVAKWETWQASLSGSNRSLTALAEENLLSEWKESAQNTTLSGRDLSLSGHETG